MGGPRGSESAQVLRASTQYPVLSLGSAYTLPLVFPVNDPNQFVFSSVALR